VVEKGSARSISAVNSGFGAAYERRLTEIEAVKESELVALNDW
jgi:hypothetical protein